MTRLITDEQILRIHQTLTDITGLVECNCSTAGCDGDCTYATAVALLAELDTLPEAK